MTFLLAIGMRKELLGAMEMTDLKQKDYFVCRFDGTSGDVIAGQLTDVAKGKATMKNLLTGKDSERALDIVNRRSIKVTRNQALEVAAIYHDTEDKQKARKAAVKIANLIKATENAAKQTAAAQAKKDKMAAKVEAKAAKKAAPAAAAKVDKVPAKRGPKPQLNAETSITTSKTGKSVVSLFVKRGKLVIFSKNFRIKN